MFCSDQRFNDELDDEKLLFKNSKEEKNDSCDHKFVKSVKKVELALNLIL